MRHYEIVLIVHPTQSRQVPAMIERYRSIVTDGGGQVHRVEDWGRRRLAYMIKEVHKAHYILLNIECDLSELDQLKKNFKFNDMILRNLVIRRDQAISELSPIAKDNLEEEEKEKEATSKDKPSSSVSVDAVEAEAVEAIEAGAEAELDIAVTDSAPAESTSSDQETATPVDPEAETKS